MPTRQLTPHELEHLANPLLAEVREKLRALCGADEELLWALRRKLAKHLIYDERGTPMHRRKLKQDKLKEQQGACLLCSQPLPVRGAVLDRLEAMLGYTHENTRLLCPRCDAQVQEERKYT